MSIHKPSTAEEEYFLQEEMARRQREAIEKSHAMQKSEREQLKQLHYMKCPKCGFDLHSVSLHTVKADKCSHCGGMWLDREEVAQIANAQESGIFQRIARFFRTGDSSSPL